jgi:hypothetical protein
MILPTTVGARNDFSVKKMAGSIPFLELAKQSQATRELKFIAMAVSTWPVFGAAIVVLTLEGLPDTDPKMGIIARLDFNPTIVR